MGSQLDEEIDSREGFPRTLRKEDRDLWEEMVEGEAALRRNGGTVGQAADDGPVLHGPGPGPMSPANPD